MIAGTGQECPLTRLQDWLLDTRMGATLNRYESTAPVNLTPEYLLFKTPYLEGAMLPMKVLGSMYFS